MDWHEVAAALLSPTTFSAVVAISLARALDLGLRDASFLALFLVVVPLAPVLTAAKAGITDLFVSDRGVRTPLLTAAVASYLAGYAYFRRIDMWPLEFTFLAYATVTAGLVVINALHTKGSIHVAGAVGPGLTLLMLGEAVGLFLLAISPIVAWVRLSGGAHDRGQVLIGGLTAATLTPAAFFLSLAL